MFHTNAIGLDVRHTGDFVIDRPNGSGDYLLVVFKTDATLTIGGERLPAPPDSAIIYGKGERQLYSSVCKSYVNHFLHFDTDNADNLYGITIGRLLLPNNISEVEALLRMISRERVSGSKNAADYTDMLIKMTLMKLCEESRDEPAPGGAHSALLSEIRAEMYSNAGQFGSVAELARRANLSLSHFQGLYKKQFGISCYEDLLGAKIKAAQFYLSSTALSVKEIAALCGFSADTSFMRRFKERTSMTPTEYRKRVFRSGENR